MGDFDISNALYCASHYWRELEIYMNALKTLQSVSSPKMLGSLVSKHYNAHPMSFCERKMKEGT